MNTQEQLAAKISEYQELVKQIAGMDAGMLRSELKRRKNTISGECVVLRQQVIKAELASNNPQPVPRLPFD